MARHSSHAFRIKRWAASPAASLLAGLQAPLAAAILLIGLWPQSSASLRFAVLATAVTVATARGGLLALLASASLSTGIGWGFMVVERQSGGLSVVEIADTLCLSSGFAAVGLVALAACTMIGWLEETRAGIAMERREQAARLRLAVSAVLGKAHPSRVYRRP